MILDTSALLAILQDEPERADFAEAIEAADACSMSVVSFVECSIALATRRGTDAVRDLDLLIAKASIGLVPVDADQADYARRAHRAFGKGNHPAGFNFGDCFAYALSKASGEPLLFKGSDFALTDVERHPASR
ncbi:MAG: type II toxin-antitoxin system VapC family toxin [Steroidobacteraceae bacterium]|nr:type II toxin-antitoxin system VapC family toxin [Steroidobacteraceae bacterium]